MRSGCGPTARFSRCPRGLIVDPRFVPLAAVAGRWVTIVKVRDVDVVAAVESGFLAFSPELFKQLGGSHLQGARKGYDGKQG